MQSRTVGRSGDLRYSRTEFCATTNSNRSTALAQILKYADGLGKRGESSGTELGFGIDRTPMTSPTLPPPFYGQQIARRSDPAGRRRSTQARLRPAAFPRDGRLLQLRDLIFNHLDPHRRGP